MSVSKFGHIWAIVENVGWSIWIRLIGSGWVIYVVGKCRYACRSRIGFGGCGHVLAYTAKGGQR